MLNALRLLSDCLCRAETWYSMPGMRGQARKDAHLRSEALWLKLTRDSVRVQRVQAGLGALERSLCIR